MSISNTALPDLLRRFVATPHVVTLLTGNHRVRLETNDPTLFGLFQGLSGYETELANAASCWKLIRDEQAPCGGGDLTLLSAGPLATLLLGRGTVIAADREKREILGFIAPDIRVEEFSAIAVPLLLDFLGAPKASDFHED